MISSVIFFVIGIVFIMASGFIFSKNEDESLIGIFGVLLLGIVLLTPFIVEKRYNNTEFQGIIKTVNRGEISYYEIISKERFLNIKLEGLQKEIKEVENED